jgi:hypothetical protein
MSFAGRLIEKYHPAIIAIAGSIILSMGYILAGFAESLLFLIFILTSVR